MGSDDIAVGEDGVLIARGDARARTEVALLRWNGRVTSLTPLLPRVGALAYDGRRIAFTVGNCVFAGPGRRSRRSNADGCVTNASAAQAQVAVPPAARSRRAIPTSRWWTATWSSTPTASSPAHTPDGRQRTVKLPKTRREVLGFSGSRDGMALNMLRHALVRTATPAGPGGGSRAASTRASTAGS